jgi:AraC-like DNA-binding protein
VDVLSQVLADLRVESSIYCRIGVGAGCGVEYPQGPVAGFHVVTAGRCWLAIGGERIALEAGDFVLLPRGEAHRVQAGPSARVEPVAAVAGRAREGVARVGATEPVAEYVCGGLRFGAPAEHPLLTALPPVIHVRADRAGAGAARPLPWLAAHIDALACESRSGRPGAETVMARLSEVLFVQAVRYELAELPEGARGWLGALRDAQLARAVGLMHRHPERGWTVASLGREVGLSRSQFAERFAAVMGRPPLGYLAEWRMFVGRALLRDGALRVGEVARRVGYGSEAAFSTAFKRATGVAPRAFRRAAAAPQAA